MRATSTIVIITDESPVCQALHSVLCAYCLIKVPQPLGGGCHHHFWISDGETWTQRERSAPETSSLHGRAGRQSWLLTQLPITHPSSPEAAGPWVPSSALSTNGQGSLDHQTQFKTEQRLLEAINRTAHTGLSQPFS